MFVLETAFIETLFVKTHKAPSNGSAMVEVGDRDPAVYLRNLGAYPRLRSRFGSMIYSGSFVTKALFRMWDSKESSSSKVIVSLKSRSLRKCISNMFNSSTASPPTLAKWALSRCSSSINLVARRTAVSRSRWTLSELMPSWVSGTAAILCK